MDSKSPANADLLQEMQGFYGPFSVSELLIQRIWLKGAFDRNSLQDSDGRKVEVRNPGTWNRSDGPDFLNAELLIDGELVVGDVEVHFRNQDWRFHGHHLNAGFNQVVLHVLYFPLSKGEAPAETEAGKALRSVSLMPVLWYDLEEYAFEDSIVSTVSPQSAAIRGALENLSVDARRSLLIEKAQERWKSKCAFAQLRVDRLGWSEACHQSAMEAMGYSSNRIPMLKASAALSLNSVGTGQSQVEDLWEAGGSTWKVSGVRPANHPMQRLKEYCAWCRAVENWPEVLKAAAGKIDVPADTSLESVSRWRRAFGLNPWKDAILKTICDSQISSGKANTLIADVFLPLASQHSSVDLFPLWFCMHAGNAPEGILAQIREFEVADPKTNPLCNGWVQGCIALGYQK